MTRIQVDPADMHGAADSVREAAAGAGSGGGGGHISGAAGAVPGSTAEDLLIGMGPEWQSDLESWRDAADDFAQQVASTGDGMAATDAGEGQLLGGLTGIFGGSG